jgi:hypothetical protein
VIKSAATAFLIPVSRCGGLQVILSVMLQQIGRGVANMLGVRQ